MILITGTSGFIGKALLQLAIREYGKANVVALTSQPTDQCAYILHSNYTFDTRVFNSFLINYVIHAGAYTPKKASEVNVSECNQNIRNTFHLLARLPVTVKKILFLSTVDVYAPTLDSIQEVSMVLPHSLYASSKRYCEQMVHEWCSQKAIPYNILRIGHIYGEGEEAYQKLIPITIRKVLNNEQPQVFGLGDELRSFLYIKDCCDLILKCLHAELPDKLVNIVSGNAYSIQQIVEKILSLANSSLQIDYQKSAGVPRSWCFNATRMEKWLGLPCTSLEVGLLGEINYFRKLSL